MDWAARGLSRTAQRTAAAPVVMTVVVPIVVTVVVTLATALFAVPHARAQSSDVVTGVASVQGELEVVEADMLRIGMIEIELENIDAPASNERCDPGTGGSAECGLTALRATLDLVRQASTVECEIVGTQARDRVIATCRSQDFSPDISTDSTNLGEILVLLGIARADRGADQAGFYRLAEFDAQDAARGFWDCTAATPRGWEADKRKLCSN